MQKRGINGIEVSRIGLGTVKFGRNEGVKYPHAFTLPSDNEIRDLLANAQALGINLLDTAPAYGASEERLGELINRNEWVLCTKAGETFRDGVSSYDFRAPTIINSVEQSLRRLRTDYVDVLLIHSNGNDLKIIEEDQVFETLARLKEQGKIRAYGMSTKTVAGGLKTVRHADVAMVTYNVEHKLEHEVIVKAYQQNKAIFVKKALGNGHLSPQDSLPFVFEEPGVTSVIIGTINARHLIENVSLVCSP